MLKNLCKDHKVPIDEQLADIVAVLIRNSKERSNDDNNPNKYIFVRYSGTRKGRPFIRGWVQGKLNELAVKRILRMKQVISSTLKSCV